MSLLKSAPYRGGDLDPRLTQGSFDPHKASCFLKQHLDRLVVYAQLTPGPNLQADRHTHDHGTCDVCSNRPHRIIVYGGLCYSETSLTALFY